MYLKHLHLYMLKISFSSEKKVSDISVVSTTLVFSLDSRIPFKTFVENVSAFSLMIS